MDKQSRHLRGFRAKLFERFDRVRGRSRGSLDTASRTASPPADITGGSQGYPDAVHSLAPSVWPHPDHDNHSHTSKAAKQGGRELEQPRDRSLDNASAQIYYQPSSANKSVPSDVWSSALREAIDGLSKEIDVTMMEGKTIDQIFKELQDHDKDAHQRSAFLRGLANLKAIKGPLEVFKLALDIGGPGASLEPIAMTVFGIVRTLTTIAITIASADDDFARRIGEMLEQIPYIDGCDTLGRKTQETDIHKALVSVYRKILEFCSVAFKILANGETKRMIKLTLKQGHLPKIVTDFLSYAEILHKIVQKATLEIAEEIRDVLYDQAIATWLGRENINRQARYHADLQSRRADKACEFLLAKPAFVEWFRAPTSRQLLLVGDMGVGKTMLTAFVIDKLKEHSEHRLPQPKVCYYYCREGENDHIDIFSTLLLSLFGHEQLSGLKRTFYQWYKRNADLNKLGDFLFEVLETLDRPVFLVIDGLDECSRLARRKLFDLLKSLATKHSNLKTFLSSRPQEQTLERLTDTAKLYITPGSGRDWIIVSQEVELQLSYLTNDVRNLVVDRVSKLAEGSGIWVKMVVELLAKRRITALEPMRSFLDQVPLPQHLSELYDILLSRATSDDLENQEIAYNALRLLSIACRPLSIMELGWAVGLASAKQDITTIADLGKLVDIRRVMNLISPFVAGYDSQDTHTSQIRLVHQSVKEYTEQRLRWSPTTPVSQQRTHTRSSEDNLNIFMLNICIRYLLLAEINSIPIFTDEQLAIDELPQETDLFEDAKSPTKYTAQCSWEEWEETMIRFDPSERGLGDFFVYSSAYWVQHLGLVDSNPLPRLADVEAVCQPGSTRLDNWIQQNCRPNCRIKQRFEFESNLYDPLSITALYGSEAVLRALLKEADFADRKRYRRRTSVVAVDQILKWGDLSRLQILLFDNKLSKELVTLEVFDMIVRQWAGNTYTRSWDSVFDLVDRAAEEMLQQHWANELFCIAACAGCMPIVRRLMSYAQENVAFKNELFSTPQRDKETGQSLHQSVGEAVRNDHVEIVKYLLEQDGIAAHLSHVNCHGESVFHMASRKCNPTIFQILIDRAASSCLWVNMEGQTALSQVISSSCDTSKRCEVIELLLRQGSSHEAAEFQRAQREALQAAVWSEDLDMCDFLLQTGKIDPVSALVRSPSGEIVLKGSMIREQRDTMALLNLLCQNVDTAAVPYECERNCQHETQKEGSVNVGPMMA